MRCAVVRRMGLGVLLNFVILAISSVLCANESTPVVVTRRGGEGDVALRVEISEGLTTPCDSGNNRPVFNGRMKPGETFATSIAGECVCVRNTTSAFPETGWTTPGLMCRRRICRGRICRPAPDPTIYVSVP